VDAAMSKFYIDRKQSHLNQARRLAKAWDGIEQGSTSRQAAKIAQHVKDTLNPRVTDKVVLALEHALCADNLRSVIVASSRFTAQQPLGMV
jgi:hypothetical protein